MRLLLLILLLSIAACDRSNKTIAPTKSANQESAQIQQVSENSSRSLQANLPSQILPTETLSPTPIRITIPNLPPPFASNSASKFPQIVPPPQPSQAPFLRVPSGFTVNIFADNLEAPRWLALTPTGDVLVTETRQNRIRLLRDTNGDGVADVRATFATTQNGLNIPFGMAFSPGNFFLGNSAEVRKFPYNIGQQQLIGIGEKIADLPGGGYNQHWTRNVIVSPNQNQLYVSIGSASNNDVESLPRASVQIMNLDGRNQQTFAYGLRNPVGLDFHPTTGELYTTVNERDGLGDDLVPDYLTRIQQGEFYGWPYTYFSPNLLDPRHSRNGQSDRPDLAAKTLAPDVLFQAHSAALGIQFYDGKTFPEKYRNGAFVALRGSWNRNAGTGYKIVFVPFNKMGRPKGYYENFVNGFLIDPLVPKTWGRPVGLLVLPDGSLLFTEEANNRIYRVQYR
ncbi:sorbosone dehydrogenase [Oscillatoriales cyanobacterium USR001]|nr:sorbosone dehydrogenase [Oscillatoriales cyanobacterium USR001]